MIRLTLCKVYLPWNAVSSPSAWRKTLVIAPIEKNGFIPSDL